MCLPAGVWFLLTVSHQEVKFRPWDEDRIRTKYLLYIYTVDVCQREQHYSVDLQLDLSASYNLVSLVSVKF